MPATFEHAFVLMHGYYDDNIQRFMIEFCYLGSESTRREEADRKLAVHVGKQSQRLYKVEIDADRVEAREVRLNAFYAIVERALDKKYENRRSNYDAAREVMFRHEAEILEGVGQM